MNSEIEELEIQINSQPTNINGICRLADLYFNDGRINKALPLVNRAIEQYLKTQLTVTQGLNVFDVAIRAWKSERFSQKKQMRINVTKERKQLLEQIHQVSLSLIHMRDLNKGQIISYKTAYVKESLGSIQDSLALLSDLISAQAVEGVDFSYIIWKAAILLKHLGQNKQAIEYLEYLEDDPPIESGYTKTHILAFLILVYEHSSEKYKVFLGATYKKLIQACTEEAAHTQSSRHQRRLMEIAKNKNLYQSSELWEILAIQALDKCEYILALELLHQALLKAPGKATILHWLVEVFFLIGDNVKAAKYGEKASILLPQSIELRNLLIQIDPDKWTEKLRFISPTKSPSTSFNNRELSPNNRKTKAGENEFSFSSIRSNQSTTASALNALNFLKPSSTSLSPTKNAPTAPAVTATTAVTPALPSDNKPVTAIEPSAKETTDSKGSSTNKWLSKITNSAAQALQTITKETRSFSPPRNRKGTNPDVSPTSESVNPGSPTLNKVTEVPLNEEGEEQEEQEDQQEEDRTFDNIKPSSTLADSIQADSLEKNLVQVLDQQLANPSFAISGGSNKATERKSSTSPTKPAKSRRLSLKEQSMRIQILEEDLKNTSSQKNQSAKLQKPKKVTEEHKKIIQFALFGNQNIHFYHPTLQALSNIQKKVEIDKKRQELMK